MEGVNLIESIIQPIFCDQTNVMSSTISIIFHWFCPNKFELYILTELFSWHLQINRLLSCSLLTLGYFLFQTEEIQAQFFLLDDEL